jgi:hypothetical protein
MLAIIISCNEKSELVSKSIDENFSTISKYPLIVINKSGGEKFSTLHNAIVINQDTSLSFSRRFALEFVKEKYVLCLDVDTILPEDYIDKALKILESRPEVAVIAIDYEESQGHYAFGTSIWKTDVLKKLYDWRLNNNTDSSMCECIYMWKKVRGNNYKIETLPMRAKHLKGENKYG